MIACLDDLFLHCYSYELNVNDEKLICQNKEGKSVHLLFFAVKLRFVGVFISDIKVHTFFSEV